MNQLGDWLLKQPIKYTLKCEFEGQVFEGWVTESASTVELKCPYGCADPVAKGSEPERIAEALLRSILGHAKDAGLLQGPP